MQNAAQDLAERRETGAPRLFKSATEYFDELGRHIESRWRAREYEDDALTEIATDALREMPARDHVNPAELLELVATRKVTLPQQADPGGLFGEPPITMYHGGRFYIDVLYWFDGTTAVHDHSFSGAFQVLAGGSVHTTLSFEADDRVSSKLKFGRVRRRGVEWLRPGDTRPIHAGSSFIHSLFHLDCPSATVVIRSPIDFERMPQRVYLWPELAIVVRDNDLAAKRMYDVLRALRTMDVAAYRRTLAEIARTADLAQVVDILAHEIRTIGPLPPEALEELDRRHGERAQRVRRALEELGRQGRIIRRRSAIRQADHRFFLGLLLNVEGRRSILELASRRMDGKDPIAAIMGWMRELVALPSPFGSQEPNALGLAIGEDDLQIFEHLLHGRSTGQILERLAEEYEIEDVAAQAEQIDAFARTLRTSTLFGPLFAEDPAEMRAV